MKVSRDYDYFSQVLSLVESSAADSPNASLEIAAAYLDDVQGKPQSKKQKQRQPNAIVLPEHGGACSQQDGWEESYNDFRFTDIRQMKSAPSRWITSQLEELNHQNDRQPDR